MCCTPWPQTIFFNYYLEDASVEGGCLKVGRRLAFSLRQRLALLTFIHGGSNRWIVCSIITQVIPGTHLRRIPLHDHLVSAHEGSGASDGGARSITEDHPYSKHPNLVSCSALSLPPSVCLPRRSLINPLSLMLALVSAAVFSDHPDQVDVLSKAGSLVLGDMRLLHAAHRNTKPTRRNLLLIWHSRPQTVPQFWLDEGREVPEWLSARLADGPTEEQRTSTRCHGTGVELPLPESLQGLGIGSLMRSEADGVLPPGAEARL